MTARLIDEERVVGLNQVKRSLDNDEIKLVYIAEDADTHIIEPIVDECREKSIDIIYVESMEELGKACNIEINAAVAALLK